MDKPELLPLSEQYIPAAAALERACFSSPWSETSLRETLQNPGAVFYVALLEKKAAGYAGMVSVLGEGYIANVAVSPAFRRRGVGRALMEKLEEYARRHAFEFLTLEVRRSNLPAITLYEKLGYQKQGERPHFYTLPDEDALIYTKFL